MINHCFKAGDTVFLPKSVASTNNSVQPPFLMCEDRDYWWSNRVPQIALEPMIVMESAKHDGSIRTMMLSNLTYFQIHRNLLYSIDLLGISDHWTYHVGDQIEFDWITTKIDYFEHDVAGRSNRTLENFTVCGTIRKVYGLFANNPYEFFYSVKPDFDMRMMLGVEKPKHLMVSSFNVHHKLI